LSTQSALKQIFDYVMNMNKGKECDMNVYWDCSSNS